MPSIKDRQTSFAGGEFAPHMAGRTDFAKYPIGCRTLLNFFVNQWGSLVSRPGTLHCDTLGFPANLDDVALVPFSVSDTESLVVALLFKEGAVYDEVRFAFFRRDLTTNVTSWLVTTVTPESGIGSTPMYVPTGHGTTSWRWCQVGDVITFTGPALNRPVELRRTSTDSLSWGLSYIEYDSDAFPAYGGLPAVMIPAPASNRVDTLVPGMYSGALISQPNIYSVDATHPALPWQWAVSRVMKRADGTVYESMPYIVATVDFVQVDQWSAARFYSDQAAEAGLCARYSFRWEIPTKWYRPIAYEACTQMPVDGGTSGWEELAADAVNPIEDTLNVPENVVVTADVPTTLHWYGWPQTPETPPAGSDEILATRIYRGRDGRFGFLDEVAAPGVMFTDDGREPNFEIQPRGAGQIFPDGTERPECIAMFEGRRWLACTSLAKALVAGSAVDEFANFDTSEVSADSGALSLELASNKREIIRALVPRRDLLILTDHSEWVLRGASDGGLVTPNSFAAHVQTQHGSAATPAPLEFNSAVWFVQRKGTVPRAMMFDPNSGGYQVIDVSTLSRHLFQGHTIVDWCYAEDPHSLVWVVRDDGVLLSCSFVPEHELVAWARHEIAGGLVESVVSIPEGTEDAVYMVVNRSGTRYLERFASREIAAVQDAVCLDAAIVYDGHNTDPDRCVVNSPDGSPQTAGTIIGSELRTAGVRSELPAIWQNIPIRLYHESGVSFDIVKNTPAGEWNAELLDDVLSIDIEGLAFYDFAVLAQTVSGLSHLNGQQVMALADGNVVGPLLVTAGSVVLPFPAAVVAVGLPYNCDFESLDMAQERSRQKVVKSVTVEVEGSRGGFVGQTLDTDDLEELPVRAVEDTYGAVPLATERITVPVSAAYSESGRVAFRQSAPLPVALLGITRDVEFGG